MTNREAISWLISLVEKEGEDVPIYEEDVEAIQKVIEALGQQPFEDCINRQAVNVLIDELARAISDERCFISRGRSTASIMQDILDLPSVTPKAETENEESAEWIVDTDDSRRWDRVRFYCSACNSWNTYGKSKYCPNCGAKMEEDTDEG